MSTSKQVQDTLRCPFWLALRLDTDKCLKRLIQLLSMRSEAALRPPNQQFVMDSYGEISFFECFFAW